MNSTGKITAILMWALTGISAVFVISLLTSIGAEEQTPVINRWIGPNLIWVYILISAGTALAFWGGLIQITNNRKAARKALTAIVIFAAVILISRLFASNSLPQFFGAEKYINSGILTLQVSKLIDTGLYTTYILIGIAVLSVILSPIQRLFR